MKLTDKIAVVTGGASGIGKALAERFHAEGAAHVVVADLDGDGADAVAASIGGTGVRLDVGDEAAVKAVIDETIAAHGRIDLFVSNAGYVAMGALETSNDMINNMWDVHVMSHIYAARHVVPSMIENGGGYLLNTASAAGLLTQIGSMSYAVTKGAAVSLAEFLAITYGEKNIGVSVLCPQAVETNIIQNSPNIDAGEETPGSAAGDGVLSAEQLADTVIEALEAERFHVLPHPEVATYVKRKADDVDRWIRGMQRFQQRLYADADSSPADWLTA
ncbi:MAG: NAD(P)-dependent dehydrogenase (short-subunit alcohol dehydrogenase family) [Candidatus Poriferisodalaceae bacterium]|jgi:NAD(P)-dependent dehydrogenase (short-subunit alcohol dehydrogenase family)